MLINSLNIGVGRWQGPAIARRQPDGVVVGHADRGPSFEPGPFGSCVAASLKGSMGRVASAADNAAMESFWALLQKNVLDQDQWRTRDSSAMRSCSGSSTPTTVDDSNAVSANSPRVEFELTFAPNNPAYAAHRTSAGLNALAAPDCQTARVIDRRPLGSTGVPQTQAVARRFPLMVASRARAAMSAAVGFVVICR